MDTVFNLQRFVDAQADIYEQVLEELKRGRKTSHWIWFIFPQIHGLGQSPTAVYYAIGSLDEAKAYLDHSILCSRLHECCDLLLNLEVQPIGEIMGYPDDLKLKSSLTLFSCATEDDSPFLALLRKYFNSEPDPATLRLLKL